ncbi:MAG: 23S rRNA (adenine(2503)-C(2))-methyltransferase RlmN [Bacteroidales bacterium]|nr:23S rRNA (adenine(2503)-C(2))-methyltransferase RlmN [Bacteroidales bacterium]
MMEEKKPLIGKTLDELQRVATEGGMPRFVGKQLAHWLYVKQVDSFDKMINLSKKNIAWLEENYVVGREKPVKASKSADGTIKYLFNVGAGRDIESVWIPDHDRATLCVSSQVGCKMNCYFCATGKLGFKANLTAAQIINQILSAPQGGGEDNGLTNVVFMGMGEPLDNFGEVLKVIEILTAPWGMAWSPKRITVSTVGKLPQLKELIEKTKVHIALSLHTADIEQRASMMPAEKAFPLQTVLKMLRSYDFSGQRRLSIEYIMWRGVNDDVAHAKMLVRMLEGLDCRVNLIRYHAIGEGVDLHPCSEERMIMFRKILNQHGITATIRTSRGEDIEAACGMLAAGKKKDKSTGGR